MRESTEAQDKKLGWLERLNELIDLLSEGHEVMNVIIGELPKDNVLEAKEPACFANEVTYKLNKAAQSTAELVTRLRQIQEEF